MSQKPVKACLSELSTVQKVNEHSYVLLLSCGVVFPKAYTQMRHVEIDLPLPSILFYEKKIGGTYYVRARLFQNRERKWSMLVLSWC